MPSNVFNGDIRELWLQGGDNVARHLGEVGSLERPGQLETGWDSSDMGVHGERELRDGTRRDLKHYAGYY